MNNERLLERFFRYISCPSESRHEKNFCIMIEEELKKLGLEVWRDEIGSKIGSDGWNIHACLPGEGAPMLFSAHLDTVSPGVGIKPVIKDGVIYSDGTTILGSDDKSGVAVIMEALESITETEAKHRTVEVMFSLCEEIGLLGAMHADYSRIRSKNALVMDSGQNGSIINMAPAQMKLHFEITGKASHAGVAPEKGIHALKAAVEAVYNIPCGNVDEYSVMNISNLISPGETNVVAPKASFDMEIRSFSEDLLKAHFDASVKAVEDACKKYGAVFTYTHEKHSDLLHVPKTTAFVKELVKKYEALGKPSKVIKTYGGCDATYINAHGIKAVNVGTGMQDCHSVTEHMAIKDFEFTAAFVENVMKI